MAGRDDDDRGARRDRLPPEPLDPSQTFIGRVPVLSDGLAESLRRAEEVLRAAREARRAALGVLVEEDEPPLPADPVARVEEVLRRAAAVRREALVGGRAAVAREAIARAELERMRAGAPPAPDDPDPVPASPSRSTGTRRRQL